MNRIKNKKKMSIRYREIELIEIGFEFWEWLVFIAEQYC